MRHRVLWSVICALGGCLAAGICQEREDRTLLPWDQMRAIINEASGERALETVLELVPYPRVRAREEYTGQFRESQVMARLAREAGYSNVEIESFPSGAQSWYASRAELWLVEPTRRKLYDVHEVAISVMPNSASGEVEAELVDVGSGTQASDYAGKDVKGKVVLGSGAGTVLQRMAVFQRGAVGVVSCFALRPDSVPDVVLSQSLSAGGPQGAAPGFGWAVSPRVGRELAARLARGEKVRLRSVIQAETFPGELEMVHATIPGEGSPEQAVMVSAHLYEGYLKMGANDDASGCAATLEMGRTLIRLINEGRLPRPRRTIHFLWVPEISGTTAWLRKHEDVRKQLVADLNFDMAGLNLRGSGSFFTLHRTPDTFPSFLNDICQSVLEFVSDLNRERVRYRHNGYRFTYPVVAPRGAADPFYARVEKHYGASDHVIYLNQGVPAVIFVTWPDMWYHSSEDTPDKLDATQFKRAVVVGTAAMSVLASAADETAARVAGESLARGGERMAQVQRKGLGYMADVADAGALVEAYREALNAVQHQAEVEKGVVRSAAALFANSSDALARLAPLETAVGQRAAALEGEVRAFYQLQARQRNVPAVEPRPAEAEQQAARLIPERVGGGPGFGFGAGQQALSRLNPEDRAAVEADLRRVPQHMTAELNVLVGRKANVLAIRNFLSGEFEPLPLADLLAYLRAQEKLGTVKLTEQPPPAPAPPPPAAKKRRQ